MDGRHRAEYRGTSDAQRDLHSADEYGGALPKRVVFFADEFGTLPKLESAEIIFSAARSRKLSIVALIQGLVQLDKNYGKEGAQVIRDNCQLTIFRWPQLGSEATMTLSAENLGILLGGARVELQLKRNEVLEIRAI